MADQIPDDANGIKVDLSRKLAGLEIDQILSCTKVETTKTTDQVHLNDVELGDLDEKIAEKLEQIKARSAALMAKGSNAESTRWLLREESGAQKGRWLVARNVENEVEISVDLIELEANSEVG